MGSSQRGTRNIGGKPPGLSRVRPPAARRLDVGAAHRHGRCPATSDETGRQGRPLLPSAIQHIDYEDVAPVGLPLSSVRHNLYEERLDRGGMVAASGDAGYGGAPNPAATGA